MKCLLFIIQIIFNQIDRYQSRYALFLHGDTIKPVRRHHGPSSVGNDNKLGMGRQFMEISGKTVYVGIIQRRLDLVQQTEWRRFQVLDRK